MNSVVAHIEAALGEAHSSATFNADDFMAILQGVVGFASAVATSNPLAFISSGVTLAQDLSGKMCPVGSLQDILDKLEKWLKFGKNYTPLEDSSDLDFDQVDVESVPEVMQVSCMKASDWLYHSLFKSRSQSSQTKQMEYEWLVRYQ